MKGLVLGGNGQFGRALADTVSDRIDFISLGHTELDISNADAVLECFRLVQPDVIINAAAYTAVDKAEDEPEVARAVNVDGPQNLATAANEVGARLIHISTDFVFDGKSSAPYSSDAGTNPLNTYGRTKRDGELAVLRAAGDTTVVIRTSWLYSGHGNNFVRTMLRLMSERDELRVVADQFGSPTWAASLAEVVWAFARAPEHSGIFHWSDGGAISWYEFAVAIQQEALSLGLLTNAIPIHATETKDYPTAATRPLYSVLDSSATHAALQVRPSDWRENLQKMLRDLALQNETAST